MRIMRKIIFILSAGVVVLVVIVLFFVFQFISLPKSAQPSNLAIPTPLPLNQQENVDGPVPNVKYDKQKTNELINKSQTRRPLSPEGEKAKEGLISGLGNTSGRIFANNNIRIDYVQSPDLFQAEILSNNVDSAKEDAVFFMLSQGFTNSDICNLPLSFYLSSKVSSELKDSNIVFNPLPDGC